MPSDIERALRGFDQRLAAREQRAIGQMLRVYADAWGRVRADAARWRRMSGSAEFLQRAQWQEEFAALIARELQGFVALAEPQTLALQSAAVTQALEDSRGLVALAGADDLAVLAMRRPNPAAVQAMIGYASDGSPLRTLFAQLAAGVPDAMAETLAGGIAQGLNAKVIAERLRDQFAVPLTRSLLIARTEVHRAYNEATMQTYRANNDLVEGWIWASACDRRSCGACFAMHGSFHRLTETLDGHPGCRCKAMPKVKGKPLPILPGADRFAALDTKLQKRVLGPGRWQAWKDGRLTLTPRGEMSIVQRRRNQQWGSMRTVRPLRDFAPQQPPVEPPASPVEPDNSAAGVRRRLQQTSDEIKRLESEGGLAALESRAAEMESQRQATWDRLSKSPYHSPDYDASISKLTALKQEKLQLDTSMASLKATSPQLLRANELREEARALLHVADPGAWQEVYPRSGASRSVQQGFAAFHSLVSQQVSGTVRVDVSYGARRAFASRRNMAISVVKNEKLSTVVHELGHILEYNNPTVEREAKAFLARRTQGEQAQWLGAGYGRDEVVKRDQFMHPYMGKVYHSGSTEIISMGLQYMYEKPMEFAREDPEYFDFIFNLMRGL